MALGERFAQPVAPPSGYLFSSGAAATIASSAAGKGPNGPSFEASLTTRSSPSSRWTSSTGFPGSYGVRARTLGRKKASPVPPGPLPSERVAIGQTLASGRGCGRSTVGTGLNGQRTQDCPWDLAG